MKTNFSFVNAVLELLFDCISNIFCRLSYLEFSVETLRRSPENSISPNNPRSLKNTRFLQFPEISRSPGQSNITRESPMPGEFPIPGESQIPSDSLKSPIPTNGFALPCTPGKIDLSKFHQISRTKKSWFKSAIQVSKNIISI